METAHLEIEYVSFDLYLPVLFIVDNNNDTSMTEAVYNSFEASLFLKCAI